MAEVISVRVVLFLVVFFLLRPLMFMLIPRANRVHALGLLGVSSLIAFILGGALLDDPLGDTLLAWLVIYGIIAGLWYARWRGADYDRAHRALLEDDPPRPGDRTKE